MLTLIAATATASGLVAALLPAIQITKMLRARSSNGISIVYLAGGIVNNVIWTAYGFALPSLALILPTVLTLTMNVTMLTVAIVYRRGIAGGRSVLPVADMAKAVVHDDELAAEFAQLLAEEHAAVHGADALSRALAPAA